MSAAACFILAAGLTTTVSSPALADHQVWNTHGSDYAVSSAAYDELWVCDREADDNAFRIEYFLRSGGGTRTLRDANGSASGCGHIDLGSQRLDRWCLAETGELCGGADYVRPTVSRPH
ncbi:hypothetical protein ACFQYP_56990 [Nonomuraea antimicrobica]